MPNTWSATTIQFLTQAELRALFRFITRKRDRALFLIAYRHGLRASEVGLLQPESGLQVHQEPFSVLSVFEANHTIIRCILKGEIRVALCTPLVVIFLQT
jgi:hypothetical protein